MLSQLGKKHKAALTNTFHTASRALLPDLYLALVTAQRNNLIKQTGYLTKMVKTTTSLPRRKIESGSKRRIIA